MQQLVDEAQLKDMKDDLVKKATGFAIGKINEALTAQLGGIGGAILGPVAEKGLNALLDAVGLGLPPEESDTDKIMRELDQIKDTLRQLQSELVKIQEGITMLAGVVEREAERINQAAKYRDYVATRNSIDAMWTVLWGIIGSIASNPTDKTKVAKARKLYHEQTGGFAVRILSDLKNMQSAVLKMLNDRESLFERLATLSIGETKKDIMAGIRTVWNEDVGALTQKHKPEIWKKLEEGPCGAAIKNPNPYRAQTGRHLPNYWMGDTWFLFMELTRPVIEQAVHSSPLLVFLAEINMMVAKATLMLTIIYNDNEGLVPALNDVVAVVNNISADANSNEHRFADALRQWIADTGTWGKAPISKHRPMPDVNLPFGHWANYWINTGTNMTMAGTYVVDNGQYYPCSLFYNSDDIVQVATRTWKDPAGFLMLAYFVDEKNKLDFKILRQGLGKSLPKWFNDFMAPKETPIPKADRFKLNA